MGTIVDLTQGSWRFHTAAGLISLDELKQNPAQPNGSNSDFVVSVAPLSVAPIPESAKLPDGIVLNDTWLRSVQIEPEDAWDHEYGKGKFYLKVFPASSGAAA